MTPAEAKAATDVIATMWQGEFRATSEVLAAVKDDNRSYKPDAKSRTAWELATHLATADIWFIDSIMKGAFEWDPEAAKRAEGQFKNVNDIVAFYKKTFPEKLKGLQAMPGEKLAEMLLKVATPPKKRTPTKPTRGSKERRIDSKKRRSDTKKDRKAVHHLSAPHGHPRPTCHSRYITNEEVSCGQRYS